MTESELDEYFLLLDQKEGRSLSDAEMKKFWDQNGAVSMDPEMRKRIEELKERAKTEAGRPDKSPQWIPLIPINFRLIASIAAGIIILTVLLFASDVFNSEIEYHTGFGEREKIVLPD